ncbi:MAG: histidinol-phosphatase HisJ family protein [Oscillospiraceae bacterium]|nr:histidinol-phosphatase HisJ family protein [Oscillospiraceae bacterium]
MNLIDCHSHSTNSPDGHFSPEEMIKTAMEKNYSAYALTDHCEVNRWFSIDHYGVEPNEYDTYDFGRDFEKSMAENTLLKEKYDGKINLLCGIELGQATHDLGLAEAIVKDKRLDFVIGSMHQLPDNDDFAFIDFSKHSVPELLEKYYAEIYKLCKWGQFDVLGHLTYTLRYIEGDNGIKVDMSPYEEIIRESFKLLIENGKGIEINTSGLRQAYGQPFPNLYWVKMFREMGGEILSIGSDSHTTEDLGKGIAEGAEIALEAGFAHLCYFKERKPQFIKIV